MCADIERAGGINQKLVDVDGTIFLNCVYQSWSELYYVHILTTFIQNLVYHTLNICCFFNIIFYSLLQSVTSLKGTLLQNFQSHV